MMWVRKRDAEMGQSQFREMQHNYWEAAARITDLKVDNANLKRKVEQLERRLKTQRVKVR